MKRFISYIPVTDPMTLSPLSPTKSVASDMSMLAGAPAEMSTSTSTSAGTGRAKYNFPKDADNQVYHQNYMPESPVDLEKYSLKYSKEQEKGQFTKNDLLQSDLSQSQSYTGLNVVSTSPVFGFGNEQNNDNLGLHGGGGLRDELAAGGHDNDRDPSRDFHSTSAYMAQSHTPGLTSQKEQEKELGKVDEKAGASPHFPSPYYSCPADKSQSLKQNPNQPSSITAPNSNLSSTTTTDTTFNSTNYDIPSTDNREVEVKNRHQLDRLPTLATPKVKASGTTTTSRSLSVSGTGTAVHGFQQGDQQEAEEDHSAYILAPSLAHKAQARANRKSRTKDRFSQGPTFNWQKELQRNRRQTMESTGGTAVLSSGPPSGTTSGPGPGSAVINNGVNNNQQQSLEAPMPTSTTNTTTATNSHGHHVHRRKAIGDWEFGESIGAGSMGQVKIARNRYTKKLCAVKVIPKGHAERKRSDKPPKESDESKDIRSVREASIGRLLYHKNICQLYEVHSMSNHFYLLFEYVSGGQLLDYIISHGCLREKNARKFARSIASALDYCHHSSVVHRDLKIENIMISFEGEIKIIDFGLSNLFYPKSLLKTFCGSLYFAAPELLNAQPYVGPAVDVWSFGIVLYVLVCGKVPFDDKSMPVLHEKIKQGNVEYPAWLSPELKDLLKRMLVVDSKQRASLHEVMLHPWMCKGYDGPPDPNVPLRKPITAPLNEQVLQRMTEFAFGSYDVIYNTMMSVIESPEYKACVKEWYRAYDAANSHESSSSDFTAANNSNGSKHTSSMQSLGRSNSNSTLDDTELHFPNNNAAKRHFMFDFHRRAAANRSGSASSQNVDQFYSNNRYDSHGLQDPTDAYHPLFSVYYLVVEDMERQMLATGTSDTTSAVFKHHGSRQVNILPSNLPVVKDVSSSLAQASLTPASIPPSNADNRNTPSIPTTSLKHSTSTSASSTPVTSRTPTVASSTFRAPDTPSPQSAQIVQQLEVPIVAKPSPVHAIDHDQGHHLLEVAPTPMDSPVQRQLSGRYRHGPTRSEGGAQDYKKAQAYQDNPFASGHASPSPETRLQNPIPQQQPVKSQTHQRHKSLGGAIRRHTQHFSEPRNELSSYSTPVKSPNLTTAGSGSSSNAGTGSASGGGGSLASSILRRLSTSRRKSSSRSNSVRYPKAPPSPLEGDRSDSQAQFGSPLTSRKSSAIPAPAKLNDSPPPPIPPMPEDFRYPDPDAGHGLGIITDPKDTGGFDFSPQVASNSPIKARKQRGTYHPSARAKSLGHARHENALQQYYNDGGNIQSEEELFDSVALNSANIDAGAMLSIQYPKQVFLKGFFSVQSTSNKSLLFIRSDIIRVLTHLGISFQEIKGGFLCYHRPSIQSTPDSGTNVVPTSSGGDVSVPASPSTPMSPGNGHWRKLSFGSGIMGSSRRKGGAGGSGMYNANSSNDNSIGNEEESISSNDSLAGPAIGTGGSDMLGYTPSGNKRPTPLRFEIYIVKVPLLSMHGIQFKKLTGNPWQYKNLATKILSELRL